MSEGTDLQFDRAEYSTPPDGAACAECSGALVGHYFDVDGRMVCEKCRYALESQPAQGSSLSRLSRALGAGLAAAAAGALVWYAIAAISGYELGLIAVAVGYAVGAAVRWGSYGRGGWRYQTIAIALTYLAIVSTYIPPIISELRTSSSESAPAQEAGAASSTEAALAVPAASTPPPADQPSGVLPIVVFFVFVLVIAIVAPFLGGFANIIGLVIIGIGLYEAWKLNRRHVMTITGPHALAPAQPEPAGA